MSEMIERVARAIAQDLARQDGNDAPVVFDAGHLTWSYVDQNHVDFGAVARAAIEAMRECDDKMLRAFWDKSASPDFYPDDSSGSEWYGDADDFKKGWAAAIDEALK